MYSQPKNDTSEIEVTIRNLPNDAKNQDILDYLEIAGPIKSHRFLREEERYSAIVVYYDAESAEQCKKYLADRYFKGRALTITSETKKNYSGGSGGGQVVSPQDDLTRQIAGLKREERRTLLGLLKNLRGDGKIFEMFLESRPKLAEAFLTRPYQD